MRKGLFTIYLIAVFCFSFSYGQKEFEIDSITFNLNYQEQPSLSKKILIPSLLAGTALLIDNGDFEKELQPRLNRNLRTRIDDYTRYAPLAGMYIADVLGVEAEHHWFDQTKNAALSLLLTQAVTTGLKVNIDKERPNGMNNESFPSGHTSLAFASATVFFEEFKNTEPLLAYSGYAFAVTTGYLRIAKNKHWLSDVILGSAIGTVVTKLVYHFDYLFAWNPFKKSESLIIAPEVSLEGAGVYMALKF